MKANTEDVANAESFFALYEEVKPKIIEMERKFSPENWNGNKLLFVNSINDYMKAHPYLTTRVHAVSAMAIKVDNDFDFTMLFACLLEGDITAFKNWIEKHKS
jgi:hypothetical protein